MMKLHFQRRSHKWLECSVLLSARNLESYYLLPLGDVPTPLPKSSILNIHSFKKKRVLRKVKLDVLQASEFFSLFKKQLE